MNPMTNMKNVLKLSERELQSNMKTSWHDQYKHSAWVFVGGLPYDLTEGDVICVFSQYGEVVNINLVRDKGTGKSRGFCFICYQDQRSTNLAVDNFNGIKLLNRTIRVDHCEGYKAPKDDKMDEESQQLHVEGCAPGSKFGNAPQLPSASSSSNGGLDKGPNLPPMESLLKIKSEKEDAPKKKKKEKKEKRDKRDKKEKKIKDKIKKIFKKRDSSNSSASGSSEKSCSESDNNKSKERKVPKKLKRKKQEESTSSSQESESEDEHREKDQRKRRNKNPRAKSSSDSDDDEGKSKKSIKKNIVRHSSGNESDTEEERRPGVKQEVKKERRCIRNKDLEYSHKPEPKRFEGSSFPERQGRDAHYRSVTSHREQDTASSQRRLNDSDRGRTDLSHRWSEKGRDSSSRYEEEQRNRDREMSREKNRDNNGRYLGERKNRDDRRDYENYRRRH